MFNFLNEEKDKKKLFICLILWFIWYKYLCHLLFPIVPDFIKLSGFDFLESLFSTIEGIKPQGKPCFKINPMVEVLNHKSR